MRSESPICASKGDRAAAVPIFLVVGPPAVGKSSTSRALAGRFPLSIHVPVDDLRNMVVSGIALPAAVWSDELVRQVTLARATAARMALTYHEAGFVVVVDDFLDPDHLSGYQPLLGHPDLYKVVLFPAQEAAHDRNRQRSGTSPARAYIDEGVRVVYREFGARIPHLVQQGWLVVDTTSMGVEETVTEILRWAKCRGDCEALR